jgi:hypothetical protein
MKGSDSGTRPAYTYLASCSPESGPLDCGAGTVEGSFKDRKPFCQFEPAWWALAIFYNLTVPSSNADARDLPSGLSTIALMSTLSTTSICSMSPVLVSQTLIVLSYDPDNKCLLSGEKTIALTLLEWTSRSCYISSVSFPNS